MIYPIFFFEFNQTFGSWRYKYFAWRHLFEKAFLYRMDNLSRPKLFRLVPLSGLTWNDCGIRDATNYRMLPNSYAVYGTWFQFIQSSDSMIICCNCVLQFLIVLHCLGSEWRFPPMSSCGIFLVFQNRCLLLHNPNSREPFSGPDRGTKVLFICADDRLHGNKSPP